MKFHSCPSEDHVLLSLSILLSAEVSHLKGVQPIMKAGTHTHCSTSPDDEGGGKTAQQRHCQPHPRQGPIPHHHLRASLLPPQRKWKICQKCVASVSHLKEWEWKEIIFLKWYWILETDLNIAIGMMNSWTVGWCIVLGGGWYGERRWTNISSHPPCARHTSTCHQHSVRQPRQRYPHYVVSRCNSETK